MRIDKANVASNAATAVNEDTGVLRGYGGGITVVSNSFFPNASATIRHGSSIISNAAGYGGGIVLHNARLIFSGTANTFSSNTAAKLGADIFAQHNSTISYGSTTIPAANVYTYNP